MKANYNKHEVIDSCIKTMEFIRKERREYKKRELAKFMEVKKSCLFGWFNWVEKRAEKEAERKYLSTYDVKHGIPWYDFARDNFMLCDKIKTACEKCCGDTVILSHDEIGTICLNKEWA